MAWLAVSKSGTERVFPSMPVRSLTRGDWFSDYLCDSAVRLPKGSVKKLIGRDLTWDDEAVEIATTDKSAEFIPTINVEELYKYEYKRFFSSAVVYPYMDHLVLRPKVDDEFITWDENGKVSQVKEETGLQKIINCVRRFIQCISRKYRKEINEENK